jgi:beta-carotene ketolase (CrtW type)
VISLVLALGWPPDGPIWSLVLVLVRTQLQTGLFIVGHDAMHGLLWPGRRVLNDRLGAAALACYAALPYGPCRAQHRRHHRWTATQGDPDVLAEPDRGAVHWYVRFMAGYLTTGQMARLLLVWTGLILLSAPLQANPAGQWMESLAQATGRVLLFCTLPLWLSSLQLFIVGTYLPHRRQRLPQGRPHPDSLPLPSWLSLVACFHFGYHREHHDNPGLAWFELPSARRHATAATLWAPSR